MAPRPSNGRGAVNKKSTAFVLTGETKFATRLRKAVCLPRAPKVERVPRDTIGLGVAYNPLARIKLVCERAAEMLQAVACAVNACQLATVKTSRSDPNFLVVRCVDQHTMADPLSIRREARMHPALEGAGQKDLIPK